MKPSKTPKKERRFTAAAIPNACCPGYHVLAWTGKHWLMLAQNVDAAEAQQVVKWYNRRPRAAQPGAAGL